VGEEVSKEALQLEVVRLTLRETTIEAQVDSCWSVAMHHAALPKP
jgi:hypothetical protein